MLQTLSRAGFFDRSLLIGSWVMPIYGKAYGASYVLRTLDLDFAVHLVGRARGRQADLAKMFSELGLVDFFTAEGLQKFTLAGYEVEFFVHRRGGRADEAVLVREWNVTARPLPFIDLLTDFSEEVEVDGVVIRIPWPEAFLVHKLIIAPKRVDDSKKLKDMEQCRVLKEIVDSGRLLQVAQARRLSKKTRRDIVAGCRLIDFPLLVPIIEEIVVEM
ncbi:MAG: hypothetical protein JRJ59_11575 [Deltaproteobacteria bacterium]|nr:hypothetical protein [Deltaproteobacteria bacterium]